MKIFFILSLLIIINNVNSQNETNIEPEENNKLTFIILSEIEQTEIEQLIINVKNKLEIMYPKKIYDFHEIKILRENLANSQSQICAIAENGVTGIFDITFTGWSGLQVFFKSRGIPFYRLSLSFFNFVRSAIEYIEQRYGKDAAIVFQNAREADEALFNLVISSNIRVIILDQFSERSLKRMQTLRPAPSFYILIASIKKMNTLFESAIKNNLIKRPDRWNLLFYDFQKIKFNYWDQYPAISKLLIDPKMCCDWLHLKSDCSCPENFNLQEQMLLKVVHLISNLVFKKNYMPIKSNCAVNLQTSSKDRIENIEAEIGNEQLIYYNNTENTIYFHLNVSIYVNQENNPNKSVRIADYVDKKLIVLKGRQTQDSKRFLHVGVIESIPWAYLKRDPNTNENILDENNNPVWEGFCIDLMQKLSEVMSYDYEISPPKTGRFGKKINNNTRWDGIIGDLITGETDIAVAPLKMTAEREEVIDFIAPYFEQTGISIVIRKPVRQTSLFKFMTVLRLEVWLSIVAALIATALMIWFLDRYSPYSARNNREAYPYSCREFSLKESFWFALTSFTPQGGGEAPKAISGRTLVAAYWLFVVLMLATFTANLAAFLTVERMQTPVQSLDQLARQSRINYTVVRNSDTHQYFSNMKFAENTLYRIWKELTLNSSSDQAEYRVWDYPIKEQYNHILLAIESSLPVKDAATGFQNVNDHIDADYAFIHDAAEIKYEISRNCNLTEVGEVFAEQPYAIAVQQGSHLQDELSRTILALQKERYFEGLTAKYWNHSVKGDCPNSDDSEGITLESLGGVFIATLFGLALAMITLVGEVVYYRKREINNKITQVVPYEKSKKDLINTKIPTDITIGTTFVPARDKRKSNISIIQRNSSNQQVYNLPLD